MGHRVEDEAIARLRRAVATIEHATRARPRTGTSHDDADDVAGSFATDSAIRFDPIPLLTELHRHGARVVVMGQVAGILHGSKELTGDLDLLWDGDVRGSARIAAAFASAGATITDPDGLPLQCTAEAFRLPKIYFETPAAAGDCCTPNLRWGKLDIAGILSRACTAVGRDGLVVHHVTATDLLAMREAVGRPKDVRRNEELRRLLEQR